MSGIDRFSRGRKNSTNNTQPPAADPAPVLGSNAIGGFGGGGDDFGFMGGSFSGFGFGSQQDHGFGGFGGDGGTPTNESPAAPINESTNTTGIGLFKSKAKKRAPSSSETNSLAAGEPVPTETVGEGKWTPQVEKRNFTVASFDGNDISGPSYVEVPAGGSHLLLGKSATHEQRADQRKYRSDSTPSGETQHSSAKTPGPKPSSHHSKTPGPKPSSYHSKTPGPNQTKVAEKTPNTSMTASSRSGGTWVSPAPEDSGGKLPSQHSDDDTHGLFIEGAMQNLQTNDTAKKFQGVSTPGVSSNTTHTITPNNATNTENGSSFNDMVEDEEKSSFGKEITTNTAKQQDASSKNLFDLNPPEDDRILPIGTLRTPVVAGPTDAMGPPPPRKKEPRSFQSTHEEFENYLRDADDKHKSFDDTLLDATVELDIATAELLECQAASLDFTMELEDLKMALMDNIQKLQDDVGDDSDEEDGLADQDAQ